jgi:hypothetical protein
MKPRQCRQKGKAFERLVAERLRALYPEAKRGIGQARASSEVADVANVPFWLEAKHHKRVNIAAAVRQAKRALADRVKQKLPTQPLLVVSRSNNEDILATMLFEDFLQLLRAVQELQCSRTN